MTLKIIKNNSIFFSILLMYWLFLGLMLLLYGYHGSFLVLNSLHRPYLNYPMFLLTHLGDALILTSVLALILIRKRPALILYIIAMVIITGLFGQLLKHTVFDSFDRPLKVFEGLDVMVHTVAGYKMFHHSFPSGHSIVAAAAITSMISVLRWSKITQAIAALSLILISFTRIYVGVHFPGDVLLGSFIGAAGALAFIRPIYLPMELWMVGFSDIKKRRLASILFAIAVISVFVGIYLIYEFID